MIDAPLDQRLFWVEIENVELVDPRRHDQQRRAQHALGGRRILDQLHQLVLEDYLARRRRHIDADHQVGRIGLADAQRAAAGLDILRQHLHAANQIVAVRFQRLAQDFRIGQHEVRRRDRVGDLLHVELGLLARVRVDALGVLHQRLGPLRGEQIKLQDEIEELVRSPLRVLEALVARRRLDCRLGVFSRHAAQRRTPEIEIGLGHLGLQVGGAFLIREPIFGDRREGLDHLGDLARRLVLDLAGLARLQIGRQRLAAGFQCPGDVHREGFSVEFLRGLGFDTHVGHIRHTIASFCPRHRALQ